jgi:hypothetical protein
MLDYNAVVRLEALPQWARQHDEPSPRPDRTSDHAGPRNSHSTVDDLLAVESQWRCGFAGKAPTV